MRAIIPVVMSGGSGVRLWPVSTEAEPKQFHPLAGRWSLFQETVLRLASAEAGELRAPVVVCNARHRDLVYAQLEAVATAPSAVVLEPAPRNTAPVAAVAARLAQEIDPEALVLLLPADHVVGDRDAFWSAVRTGARLARSHVVVFGVRPSGPETGYGYIRRDQPLGEGVFSVARFCEKPDLATAESYVASGEYDWNAGIFLFSPEVFLEELQAARPDVAETADAALRAAERVGSDVRLELASFSACPSVSIDYAVMEHTRRAAVVPCDVGWADIGSWSELWRFGPKDADGNHVRGRAALVDCKDSLVWAPDTFVGLVGVENVLVVAAHDGVIVVAKDRAQDVKLVVDAFKASEARQPTAEELIQALSHDNTQAPSV